MPGTLALAVAVLAGLATVYFLYGLIFGGAKKDELAHGLDKDESNFVQRMAEQVRFYH